MLMYDNLDKRIWTKFSGRAPHIGEVTWGHFSPISPRIELSFYIVFVRQYCDFVQRLEVTLCFDLRHSTNWLFSHYVALTYGDQTWDGNISIAEGNVSIVDAPYLQPNGRGLCGGNSFPLSHNAVWRSHQFCHVNSFREKKLFREWWVAKWTWGCSEISQSLSKVLKSPSAILSSPASWLFVFST